MSRFIQHLKHLSGRGDHPDAWEGPPPGFYLSDREATLRFMAASGNFPAQTIEKLADILGKLMSGTIQGREFSVSDGHVQEIKDSRVVRRGRTWIEVESFSEIYDCQMRNRILQDPAGGFWSASNRPLWGYREYFRPITEAEFRERATGVVFNEDGFPVVTPLDLDPETLVTVRRMMK
jgi:hypothetical protein